MAILRSGRDPAYVINEKLKRCKDFKDGYDDAYVPMSYKGNILKYHCRKFTKGRVGLRACDSI